MKKKITLRNSAAESAEQKRRQTGNELLSFILPAYHPTSSFDFEKAKVFAIIPTHKPGDLTRKLVRDLIEWNPHVSVYVVDDCTPQNSKESLKILEEITSLAPQITMLRTPVNKLKAGALNYALEYIFDEKNGYVPDVILTLDDDVVIEPKTVRNLTIELMSHNDLAAVCSQCAVLNKNKNLLTRLQGLEYVGFNATRLADKGFFRGPLVMHGMLTAFRADALREVDGFAEGHLIEDYEITTRLKTNGWRVASAVNARAWTMVPESFSKLWRQRTRWSYGGITVVSKTKNFSSVLQDLIGHATFWATIIMIDILILSTVFGSGGHITPQIPNWIIVLSLTQVAIWYVFQLWLMKLYKEKDAYDWFIRISLIPEFLYGNVLTLVLIGGYFFLFFNTLTNAVARGKSVVGRIVRLGDQLFAVCGYTKEWGTRMR